MKPESKRLLAGFIIAPWIIGMLAGGVMVLLIPEASVFTVSCLFTTGITYLGLLVFGLPSLYLLKRFGSLRLSCVLTTAFASGCVSGIFLFVLNLLRGDKYEGETLTSIIFVIGEFGLCGMLTGLIVWAISAVFLKISFFNRVS